ncbi:MAG: valine--pyruvate aminotransferase [Gammaproteobacteria bacterium]|jgi:valine--pyruvate aminotransferase
MSFSKFQKRFTEHSGIVRLMDDLGDYNSGEEDIFMLGGGNPAHIPEVQQFLQERLQRIASDPVEFAKIIGNYDPPRGESSFLCDLVDLFNSEYGWELETKNIALTTGSQSAFFLLFNMYSGEYEDRSHKKILLPMIPEYIGYSDLGLTENQFIARTPIVEKFDDNLFKYHVDFDQLNINSEIGALCVSRPTNPTGNVLSDVEMERLCTVAKENNIPLIIDNAYGMPFPNIMFTDAKIMWNQNIILCMSLSKFGLPGARTGIIIANDEIINSIVKMNAILNLSLGSIGPALVKDIVQSRDILHLSNNVIKHYYQRKAILAVDWIKRELEGIEYFIHKVEGAIFIWLWLPNLPIRSEELYQRIKQRGVIIVPGNYFFPGLQQDWSHQHECLRISYAMHESVVEQGIKIIGEEIRLLY